MTLRQSLKCDEAIPMSAIVCPEKDVLDATVVLAQACIMPDGLPIDGHSDSHTGSTMVLNCKNGVNPYVGVARWWAGHMLPMIKGHAYEPQGTLRNYV